MRKTGSPLSYPGRCTVASLPPPSHGENAFAIGTRSGRSTVRAMVPPAEDAAPRGDRSLFPLTAWSRVATAGHAADATSVQALEDLCRRYARPARLFLRALGCPETDVDDVCQEFFVNWARPEVMRRLDPAQGRLRSYVKQALRREWHSAWRKSTAQRRGGTELARTTLDEAVAVADDDATRRAELAYDAEWARTLLEGVLSELRSGYASRGKGAAFDALRPALYGAGEVQPYRELGVSAGMTEPQVKLEIHRLRRRFGEALRRAVAETVAEEAHVADELGHLLRVLAHEDRH